LYGMLAREATLVGLAAPNFAPSWHTRSSKS